MDIINVIHSTLDFVSPDYHNSFNLQNSVTVNVFDDGKHVRRVHQRRLLLKLNNVLKKRIRWATHEIQLINTDVTGKNNEEN